MNERLLRRQAATRGFRLVPEHKLKEPAAQLVRALTVQRIDAVIDVGANIGQYATTLREQGWGGPIFSIEPLPEAHAILERRAAGDSNWLVGSPLALAERCGTDELDISAESDMSSLLPQSELLRSISPSSMVRESITVPICRLDFVPEIVSAPWQRLFVKLDVQGAESRVLDGVERLWSRIIGLQLELSMVELYRGERPWRQMLDRVGELGLTPHLWIPGYFERHLARQLQVDVVLFRDSLAAPDCA